MSDFYIDNFKKLLTEELGRKPSDIDLLPFIDQKRSEIIQSMRDIERIFKRAESDDKTLRAFFEAARKEYLSTRVGGAGGTQFIDTDTHDTWLTDDRESEINWNYFDRYERYLSKSRPADDVKTISLDSRRILARMGDPKNPGPFFKKGLVYGEVQSGKTGNFNAVINRSIDSGYQLVIVLSGIMDDLRKQTQFRIESDVIGEGTVDTQTLRKGAKGVGRIVRFGAAGGETVTQVVPQTSYNSDFDSSSLEQSFSPNQTSILVCKKNVSILRNLIFSLQDWVPEGETKHQISLLLLDDEADNASLNNLGAKGSAYASKINGHLRALLDLFDRRTYLGYTATPFANVLQHYTDPPKENWVITSGKERREFSQVPNLFPDNFIARIRSPRNYVGAKQIFETVAPPENSIGEKLPIVSLVRDEVEQFPSRLMDDPPGETKGVENFQLRSEWDERIGPDGSYEGFNSFREYRKGTRAASRFDGFPHVLPGSLKEAVQAFVISTAVRDSRDSSTRTSALYQPHNTMLIHISRFMSWQNRTRDLVEQYVKELRDRIEQDAPKDEGSIYFELEKVWLKHQEKLVGKVQSYMPEGYRDEYLTNIVFDSVCDYLPQAVRDINVKAINSGTGDSLNYDVKEPQKVIAIGGNRLSRGFTLEGLTVNYFVRTTNFADTLFQMGRWFGYRPGYLDCCLLFTTEDALDKFNSTTRCVEELEAEFDKVGGKPKSYRIRVRNHPGVLKVTRQNLLRGTQAIVGSYQDTLQMTTGFAMNSQAIEGIWSDFRKHISPLFSGSDLSEKGFFHTVVSAAEVVKILRLKNNFDDASSGLMQKFISNSSQKGYLTKWHVIVKATGSSKVGQGKGKVNSQESGLPGDVTLGVRNGPTKGLDKGNLLHSGVFKASGRSANIMTAPDDMAVALSESKIKAARDKYETFTRRKLRQEKPDWTEQKIEEEVSRKIRRPPEFVYREALEENEGVLIIYLFDTHYVLKPKGDGSDDAYQKYVAANNLNLDIPLVGYALGFPKIKEDIGNDYLVREDYDLEEAEHEEVEPEDDDLPNDAKEEALA
ncbi:hypothetical protein N9395_02250 [Pseudomonadales bacterium]|nr:hypothetical protein [Pseudomonadales bacterium]